MSRNDFCLYNGNHLIPVFLRNCYSEEKNLSINIFDFGDKLQIKLRDLAEYSFNYMENLEMGDFETLRINQCLDVNFTEFKTNFVDMLYQFQRKEMFLKCQISDKLCSLIFFTKSKIKDIVYLTLDLHMTDQKEIIAEMHSEMHDLQDTNGRLQKQLSKAQKTVRDKELEVSDLDATRKLMLNQFCKNIEQIEKLSISKLTHIQNQVINKITAFKSQVSELERKINVLKQENHLKVDSSDRLMKTMENLRLENMGYNTTIEDLRRENRSLNHLRVTLERNVADLKHSLDDVQNNYRAIEKKKFELENDLKQLSIIVTEKDSKISELSKDLVQANNMLVQFNNRFDVKVQQFEDLQQTLSAKEILLQEQKHQSEQILNSFENYKGIYNNDKFETLKLEASISNQRVQELEGEIRKLNKINAILTQKVGEKYFSPK
ncbi:spindle assembly abnormal protein 6 homolog [Dendroctonus ponderosae]|uniref:spindle assembly abnormal protein 6 homolog n=1 Tax=Dendroctonus ponderosae TaxID=77166 RepID=UPI0020358998|nr:spindle assembly abnormal protein 6 homolog [Dendroctonus ponderosae]